MKKILYKMMEYEFIYPQQCFTLKDLAITGHDVMSLGVETGPRVGEVLSWLLAQVLDEEVMNEHDTLIEEAKSYLAQT